ncbi:hypothetical protein BKH42_08535 [Helicobacter sp. 13S00482-2]|nr:hypothetical protein BKH42_08535 [Helicobacter sp. 13S00482-2]
MPEKLKVSEPPRYFEDLTLLPLHEVLLCNGFILNKDKSSRSNPVLNNGDEHIVITKKGDHYLYFNADGSNDRGNIINFCKNRKLDVKTIIHNFHNEENKNVDIPKYFTREKKHIDEYHTLNQYNPKKNQFFLNKGIYDSTIEPYLDCFKQDNYGNICFPHYKLIEEKIITICGYTQRLSIPLYKDKEGNLRDKPLKNIHHGEKCLEILNINKESGQIKQIVFGESIVDLLSFMQIYNSHYSANETILVSTAGNFQEGIKPTLNKLFELCKEAKVITCFDNDKDGLRFTNFIQDLVLQKMKKGISTYKPFAKDVNDDLKLRQITQLSQLNTKSFEDYLEKLCLDYRRYPSTQKRKTILEKLRKIDGLKPLKDDLKERFNQIQKHKAIKSL